MAVVFALLSLVKITIVIINPRAWMKIVRPIYKNPKIALVVFALLAVISGYYVLQNISLPETGAVMLFLFFLVGIGIIPYSETMLKLGDEVIAKGVKNAWFATIIWLVFALLLLYASLAS